jgi:2-iminobutanoate/2-iminopropanoate deaminase
LPKGEEIMAKREVIEIPGLAHGAPIPNGAKIGNIVYSSAISGRDTKTNELPSDPDKQAEVLFENIRKFMEIAGGSPDDIIRMTVYIKEEEHRDAINKPWIAMFPDEHNRPARHAIKAPIRGGMLFQIEIVAVL